MQLKKLIMANLVLKHSAIVLLLALRRNKMRHRSSKLQKQNGKSHKNSGRHKAAKIPHWQSRSFKPILTEAWVVAVVPRSCGKVYLLSWGSQDPNARALRQASQPQGRPHLPQPKSWEVHWAEMSTTNSFSHNPWYKCPQIRPVNSHAGLRITTVANTGHVHHLNSHDTTKS